MIKYDFDMPRLERGLKRFAGFVGETNAQAVMRWGVQVCRELAGRTQVWGTNAKKAKEAQQGAIISDAYKVLIVVESLTKSKGTGYTAKNQGKSYGVSPDKALMTSSQVNNWIEMNRTRRRGRTASLPISERKVCPVSVFNESMKARFAKAGMAKGAWIGAGKDLAASQTGGDKTNIGKNFLTYAQKHGGYGSSTKPKSGARPWAGITNELAYTRNNNVLAKSEINNAIGFGLRKTLTYYKRRFAAEEKKRS